MVKGIGNRGFKAEVFFVVGFLGFFKILYRRFYIE